MLIHLVVSVLLLLSLPAEAGKFKRIKSGGGEPASTAKLPSQSTPAEIERAEYSAPNGERFFVEIFTFEQEGKAYEFLTQVAAAARNEAPATELGGVAGTAGFAKQGQLTFFKGAHFVRVSTSKSSPSTETNLVALARSLSETLDEGEGDIPVLIKHLPNPAEAQKQVLYVNSFQDLASLPLQQPVLAAVQGDGNADAALASLGASKLLLVEFNTPQLAAENDRRIQARVQELWKSGQPAPTAYRRVGNYSVFVFDAPDEQTAKQLIDQVHYEQVVSWLGENPNILRQAQEHYVNTTLGVLVAVVKASGYALVACLGLGGLIGALLFTYRRSQQKAVTAYSDAGGMLRLNLDEMTADVSDRRR